MFGYLRFILAFMVMFSHIGVKVNGLNIGVIAVVIFYILAGYVVSHLYRDIFSYKKNSFLLLYKDRLLRILPLYLYIIFITTLFLSITSFANPKFEFITMLNNLTIIPLNYYMYIDSTILTSTTPAWNLIPPAWSLGTELQAYILLPFAIIFMRLRIFMFLVSFIIYMLANFSILNPDYYGYRFIVGVFFIFLLGFAIQRDSKQDKIILLSIWITISLFALIFLYKDSFSLGYTKETFIGLLIGLPIVYLLSKIKIKLPLNSILGSLSYAIFLTHFLAIWILQYNNLSISVTTTYIIKLILVTLFISSVGILLVEKNRYLYNKGR